MKNLSSVDLRGNVAEIIWEKFVDIDIFLFVIIEHFFFPQRSPVHTNISHLHIYQYTRQNNHCFKFLAIIIILSSET